MANLRQLTLAAACVFVSPFLTVTVAGAAPGTDRALIAMGLCSEMERLVNALVDYTTTTCLPNITGTKGATFIFISDKPVFAVEASKKAWIIVVVSAVGKTLNDNPTYSADKVLFADAGMAQEKRYDTVPAALAKSLQRKAYNGQIPIETMWSQITSALTPYTAPTPPSAAPAQVQAAPSVAPSDQPKPPTPAASAPTTSADEDKACGSTKTQRDAAAKAIRSAGYDCQIADSVCPYIFSEGYTVSCNSFRYVFEVANHGGRWSVTAK